MGLSRMISGFFRKNLQLSKDKSKRRLRSIQTGMMCAAPETLESRLVLFAASGDAWPSAAVITISFEPDGTNLGGVNSNLNQAFNGNSDLNGRWQSEILRAAQVWAQATDINFVVVSDNGAASGSGKNEQGDPGFGDIRIGGYNFGNSSLAGAYMPPPDNNYSVAGDIVFNTGASYGIGQNYDLFTVAVHEFGHALGLDHTSASSSAELWASYNGVKPKLSADDIAGIRSIYSGNAARSADDYDAAAPNNTITTATDVTSELVRTKSSAVISDLDLTATTDVDFYAVTVPKWTADTMIVSVQSTGLSLLSPKLTVYAADQKTILGTATGLNQYGTTVSVSVGNVTSGQTYYVKVEGADTSPFSVGSYGLILDLGAKTSPTVTPPKTTKANGKTPSSGGGVAEGGGTFDEILAPTPTIEAISPDTGVSSTDRTTSSTKIVLNGVGSIASVVEVFENGVSLGKTLDLLGIWSFSVPGNLSDGSYTFTAKGTSLLGQDLGVSDSFTVKIDTQSPNAPTFAPISGTTAPNGTFTTKPTLLSGSTDASNLITIYDNGAVIGTTTADGSGNWSYNFSGGLADGTHRLTVTSTDQAGNTGVPSSAQTVTVDTSIADPQVTGINSDTGVSSQDHITQTRNLVIQGQAEAGSLVTIFRDGVNVGTVSANNSGTWTFDYTKVTLTDGTYSFTAKAVDAAGNTSNLSAPMLATVDNAIAASSISYVTKTTALLLLSSLNVQGTAGAGSSVRVFLNGFQLGTVTVDSQGNWLYQYSPLLLPNGNYQFTSTATDLAGNQSGFSNVFTFVNASTSAAVTGLSLSSPSTNTASGLTSSTLTPTITGTAPKSSIVSVFDGSTLLGTVLVGSTGRWSYTTPVLAKGRHSLVAVATDAVGSGLPSAVLTFLV
ncbi:MAG: hypothetical protein JWM11_4393 [Planctomycetaceae bacterium]|nr:hypothetical protein [Planctomycetaceae bacterium]